MLKVGLIGCGGMGSIHAECWLALGDRVRLAAIADPCQEKVKKYAGRSAAQIYKTGSALLEQADVDIIDICVPTYLHAVLAAEAMEQGRHVFIEKPVCLCEEEAQLLLDTQKKTGVCVQVGQVIRFWDEYAWLKNEIDKGTYGKVVSATFNRLSARPKWSWEDWYNDYTKSGTMALDLHVHDADFVRYLMGREPDKVDSRAVRDRYGIIQQIYAVYNFGDTVITAEGGWNYPDNFPFAMGFRIRLEKALVILNNDGVMTVYLENGDKFHPEIHKEFEADTDIGINVSSLGAYYNELRYFTKMIESGDIEEIAPLCEAVESARLVWKEIAIAGGAKR